MRPEDFTRKNRVMIQMLLTSGLAMKERDWACVKVIKGELKLYLAEDGKKIYHIVKICFLTHLFSNHNCHCGYTTTSWMDIDCKRTCGVCNVDDDGKVRIR